ncbi:MAG: hypothetical protein OET44_20270, partial [Gammaproteobacteria bacterium]|nr:hypothetical protein [Gammaproteobacteria bacterium]
TIETQPFRPLVVDNYRFDPFDAASVNSVLAGNGLVYSAGFGIRGAAHFFLAELDSVRECEGVRILIAGREHARDVSALPAMSMQDTVFIRRDAIARMLWEKAQEASWHKHDTPMRRALQAYGFESAPYTAIARMVNDELETFVQHELGELHAGALLGCEWQDLLARALGKPAEPLIRAVRDNIADALTTLPYLLRDFRPAALHFYFSTLGPLRKSLQPSLINAYDLWRETQQLAQLQQLVERSAEHWLSVAKQLPLDDWERGTAETFVAAHSL